jgi:hypothetical protein
LIYDSIQHKSSEPFAANSSNSNSTIGSIALITLTVLAALTGFLLQRSARTRAQSQAAALRTARDEALLYKGLTEQQQESYAELKQAQRELQAEQEEERIRSEETLHRLSYSAKSSIDESEAAWAELSRRVLDKHYRKHLQQRSSTSTSSSNSSSSSSSRHLVHKRDVKLWYAAVSKRRYAQAEQSVKINLAEYGLTAADAQEALGPDGKYIAERTFTCRMLLLVNSVLTQQLGALQALETALVTCGLDSSHMLQLMVDTVHEQAVLVSPWAESLTAATAAAGTAAAAATSSTTTTATAATTTDNSDASSSSSGGSPQGSLELAATNYSSSGNWNCRLPPILERSDSERSASPSPRERAAAHTRARSLDSAKGMASAAAASAAAAAAAAAAEKNAKMLASIARFASSQEQRPVTAEDILTRFNGSPEKSSAANGKANGQSDGPSNGHANGFFKGDSSSGTSGGTSSAGHTPRLTADAVARVAAAAAVADGDIESSANSRRGSGASATGSATGNGSELPKTPKTPKEQFDDMVQTVGKHLVRAFGQELTAPPSPPC